MPDTDDAAKAATAATAAASARQRVYDQTRASATGYKAALTRMIAKADVILAAAATQPASRMQITEFADHLSRLQSTYGKMEAVFDTLATKDPANSLDYEASMATEDKRFSKCCDNLIDVAARMGSTLDKPPTAASSGSLDPASIPGAPKAVSALKPVVALATTHSTVQLYYWIEQFEQYYTSSKLDKASLLEQQGYLRSCMDSGLFERIRPKIGRDMPIFGARGCVMLLRNEFLRLHPLFSRRMEFFRSVQPASQLFSEWGNSLELMAAEAEIDKMDIQDHISMRYMIGGSDQKLLDEMLRLKQPTLDELKLVVDHYEMNVLNKTNMAVSTSVRGASSKKVSGKGKSSGYVPTPGYIPTSASSATTREERLAELKSKNVCIRCGKPWSKDHNCPAANKGKCTKCGAVGHWGPVCLESFKDTKGNKLLAIEHNPEDTQVETRVVLSSATFGAPTPRMEILVHANKSFLFPALPDTGATGSILSSDLVKKHGIKVLPAGRHVITVANGERILCDGRVTLPVTFQGLTLEVQFLTSSGIVNDIYMSWQDLECFGVLPPDFPSRRYSVTTAAASVTHESLPKN